jgi:hemolysin type calcium-binding protein
VASARAAAFLTTLAVLPVLSPAAARGASLQVTLSQDRAGAITLVTQLGLDPELLPAPAALDSVTFSYAPGVRLGAPAQAPSCPGEQVQADERLCPAGSLVGTGQAGLSVLGAIERLALTAFDDPGGQGLSILATGSSPLAMRSVIAGRLDGNGGLSLTWPLSLSDPVPSVVAEPASITLELEGAADRAGAGWVHAGSCTGTFTPVALVQLGAQQQSLTAPAVPCPPAPAVAPPGRPQPPAPRLCARHQPGIHCGLGYGRRTSGGAGKVSHAGWPAITGELLMADNGGRRARGSALNDEILGGHGSDVLSGGAGADVIWGDQHPTGNDAWQRDVVYGGPGKDWIYTSHGYNQIHAGPGDDHVYAYYGHGSIDCGSGHDVVRIRLGGPYSVRGCEVIGHFCAFGPDGRGGCLKPGEKRAGKARRVR